MYPCPALRAVQAIAVWKTKWPQLVSHVSCSNAHETQHSHSTLLTGNLGLIRGGSKEVLKGETARPGEELLLNLLSLFCWPLITLSSGATKCLRNLVSTTLDLLGRLVCSEWLGQKLLEIAGHINTANASMHSQQVHIPGVHLRAIFILVTSSYKTYMRWGLLPHS